MAFLFSSSLYFLAAITCCLVLITTPANGEVELVCPGIGTDGSEYIGLTPGPRTIIFKETVTREGSPFRLSIYRNGQECVVLDHIPYQSSTNNMYYITVDIPDFTCSRTLQNCQLVLRQIDTQSSRNYCQFPSTCTQYNSTAPISVRGSSASNNACPSRRKPAMMYNWPNDPSRRFTATLQSSTSTARASGQFVLVGSTLLYNVTMTVPFNTPTRGERLRFFYYPVAERADILGTIDIDGSMTWHAGSWRDLSTTAQQLFINGQLYVDIITSATNTNGDVIGQITATNSAPVDNLYGIEFGNYASNGWLVNAPFTGPQASAVFFARPEGPCINTTRYFGCMLTTSITNGGGTFGLSLTGTRMVFGVDLYNTSTINSVNIIGIASDTIELAPYWSDGYRVNGVTDISSQQQSRIMAGLSDIEISTRNGQLKCDLQEGIVAFLESGLERPPVATPTNGSGTAFISFSVSGNATVQITVNSLSSPMFGAHLHAPAPQGLTTSSIPFDISRYIRGMNGSSWNIKTTLTNLTAPQLRYFIEGLYYLNMHTTLNPAGELRGQASRMGWWVCPSSGTTLVNQCKFIRLTLADNVQVQGSLTPAGIGAVVLDRVQRLQISLSLWYIPANQEPLDITLTSPDGDISTYGTTPSINRENVQEVNEYYPADFDALISDRILNYALNGQLAINITTPTYTSGYLYSAIPPLQQNQCGEQSTMYTVGGANGWSSGQDYFPLRMLQNDVLSFTFSAPDAVFLMENKNRYDGCVFATATLLSATPGTFRYTLSTPGTHYIASNSSCQAQRPMKFPVHVVASYTGPMLDSSTCSRSLYTYTADQRYVNSGSNSGILAAAILGLIVGIAVVVTVIVVMVILIVRRRMNGDSADLSPSAKA